MAWRGTAGHGAAWRGKARQGSQQQIGPGEAAPDPTERAADSAQKKRNPMKVTLTVTGNRPLLMHNGRLANPIDPWSRRLKELTGKRKKTDEDLIAIMQIEARGSAYETSDGLLGLPTQNVWKCVHEAAKAYKRGEDIKRAFLADDSIQPLIVGGQHVSVDAFLAVPEHIDYRPVAVNRARTMRARCLVPEWSGAFHFDLLEDVIDARDLAPILERAGRLVGLCEWRPTYGTFNCEVA